MVIRFTLKEAAQFKVVSDKIEELENSINEQNHYKNAHSILNSNLLFNETSLETIASILLEDVAKRLEELKTERKGLGREYKS